MIRFILAVVLLTCSLFTDTSFAQTTWTLQKCIDQAFEHSLQIKQSSLGSDQAEIGFLGARGAFLPSLNGSGSFGYNIGMTIDPFTNQFATDAIQSSSFGLSSGVTLFNGFKNHINLRRAKIGLELAKTNKEQTENDLALTVSGAYLNVLFQDEFVVIAKSNLEATQRQVDRVTQLVDAGAVPQADLLDVKAQEANDLATLISSENALQISKLTLTQLIQLPYEETASFEIAKPNANELDISPIPATALQAIENALRTFPEIKAASLNVDDAYLNLDLSKTGYMPRLFASYNFGSGYSGNRKEPVGDPVMSLVELGTTSTGETVYYAGVNQNFDIVIPFAPVYSEYQPIPFANQLGDNINQSIFFSLNIPIFNGFTVKNSVSQARVEILRSKYALESTSQLLTQTIETAWTDAISAQKTLAAQEAALNSAELAFANTELRFEAGAISALEYADARTRLDNSKINSLRTRYDLVFKSKILDFYLGRAITLQ